MPRAPVTCPVCSTTFTPPTPDYHAKGGKAKVKKGFAGNPELQEKARLAREAKKVETKTKSLIDLVNDAGYHAPVPTINITFEPATLKSLIPSRNRFYDHDYSRRPNAIIVGRGPSATLLELSWIVFREFLKDNCDGTPIVFFCNDAVEMLKLGEERGPVDVGIKVAVRYDLLVNPSRRIDTADLHARGFDYLLLPENHFPRQGHLSPEPPFLRYMCWEDAPTVAHKPVPTAFMAMLAAHHWGAEKIILLGMDSYHEKEDWSYSPECCGSTCPDPALPFMPEGQRFQIGRMPTEILEKCVHYDDTKPVWRQPRHKRDSE